MKEKNLSSKQSCISVIIPVYNGAAFISDCIQSILDSSFEDYEIIVVDDGSTDATADVVKMFPCRYYRFPTSHGAARARNYGAKKARGKILFFTDADITIQRDTLKKIYSFLHINEKYHAVIGSYTKHTPVKKFFSKFKNYCHHFTHQKSREEALTFWTGCGAIDRKVFLDVGGFKESYVSASIEDIEFGYRISKQGYRIKLEKSIQVTHMKHYSFNSLVKSDVLNRAVPWTKLMLSSHTFRSDLNTTFTNAISVFTAHLIPVTILLSMVYPGVKLLVIAQMLVFAICNMDFYRFVLENDSLVFTLQSVAMSYVYFYYSGIGLILGFLFHLMDYYRQ